MNLQIVEEHHEAYICIEKAFQKGVFQSPATLVHIDSHDDIATPHSLMSCYHPNYRKYVEDHLYIDSYITPLILRGRINKVIFVNKTDAKSKKRIIGSVFGNGKNIKIDFDRKELRFFPDWKAWMHQETTNIINIDNYVGRNPCILDIDCDYFSCNASSRVPITFQHVREKRKTLEKYLISDDRYRIKLNFLIKDRKGNMDKLVFNDSMNWIKTCIDYLTYYMNLNPTLVIISKSAKSGFTPKIYISAVIERLIMRLNKKTKNVFIPKNDTLKLSKYITRKDGYFAHIITGKTFHLDDFHNNLINHIVKGKTIFELKTLIMRKYRLPDKYAEYELLRSIFNLKRNFIIN